MSQYIEKPTKVQAAGEPPKWIEEFIGHANTPGCSDISIARMNSPAGWAEPGQVADFDEYTLVLDGALHIETADGAFTVASGQAFIAPRGQWVRYSTPEGAEYCAVCVPAFTPGRVTRDAETHPDPEQ